MRVLLAKSYFFVINIKFRRIIAVKKKARTATTFEQFLDFFDVAIVMFVVVTVGVAVVFLTPEKPFPLAIE